MRSNAGRNISVSAGEIMNTTDKERIKRYFINHGDQIVTASDIGHELNIPTRKVASILREFLDVKKAQGRISISYQPVHP
jgi:hypothetical protein